MDRPPRGRPRRRRAAAPRRRRRGHAAHLVADRIGEGGVARLLQINSAIALAGRGRNGYFRAAVFRNAYRRHATKTAVAVPMQAMASTTIDREVFSSTLPLREVLALRLVG